jgi:transcriptional regulator with XRE-family HTH domain
MGYGGKVAERRRARELRAESWTLADIARELGVSKSSVSVWVRDIEFVPRPRNRGHVSQRPHPMHLAKLAEIERCDVWARETLDRPTDREFLVAGAALYAGEGAKTDGSVKLANTNPGLLMLFLDWLRYFFDVDEARLRVNLYLHVGLDVERVISYWSELTAIPENQFTKPYRAVADPSIRRSKHPMGCPCVVYSSSSVHRRVMGLVRALTFLRPSGVAQLAEQSAVNRFVVGSSPTPGAGVDGAPSGAPSSSGGGSSVVRAGDS